MHTILVRLLGRKNKAMSSLIMDVMYLSQENPGICLPDNPDISLPEMEGVKNVSAAYTVVSGTVEGRRVCILLPGYSHRTYCQGNGWQVFPFTPRPTLWLVL